MVMLMVEMMMLALVSPNTMVIALPNRSEERRVGKEC